jgi:formamidopyrimidine-DNA glycosylase
MPELPETETIARDLHRALHGRSISDLDVPRRDILRGTSAKKLRVAISGARIERAWRRAKCIVVDLSTGDRLVFQPRFTGAVRVVRDLDASRIDPYVTAVFALKGGGAFYYRDVRRLGTVRLLGAAAFSRLDRRLGVEPLDAEFTSDRLSAFLRDTRRPVKKVLMDQERIAGVGNIYANEALWLAGVDPSLEGRLVRPTAVGKLRDAVVVLLLAAIEARGTTFRDFQDPDGNPGGFAAQLRVYGRAGEPCLRCGTRLVGTHTIDGRSTVFCYRCQH